MAIGNAHDEPPHDHPLHVDLITDKLVCRQDLTGEFYLADRQGAPAPLAAGPAEEKSDKLPQRIHAKASRHHRIALEMAGEEPQIGVQVELRDDLPLAMRAAGIVDPGDPVTHQHRRHRQLRIAGPEKLALRAGDKIVVTKGVLLQWRHVVCPRM